MADEKVRIFMGDISSAREIHRQGAGSIEFLDGAIVESLPAGNLCPVEIVVWFEGRPAFWGFYRLVSDGYSLGYISRALLDASRQLESSRIHLLKLFLDVGTARKPHIEKVATPNPAGLPEYQVHLRKASKNAPHAIWRELLRLCS
jgi:hypothetical protein